MDDIEATLVRFLSSSEAKSEITKAIRKIKVTSMKLSDVQLSFDIPSVILYAPIEIITSVVTVVSLFTFLRCRATPLSA